MFLDFFNLQSFYEIFYISINWMSLGLGLLTWRNEQQFWKKISIMKIIVNFSSFCTARDKILPISSSLRYVSNTCIFPFNWHLTFSLVHSFLHNVRYSRICHIQRGTVRSWCWYIVTTIITTTVFLPGAGAPTLLRSPTNVPSTRDNFHLSAWCRLWAFSQRRPRSPAENNYHYRLVSFRWQDSEERVC